MWAGVERASKTTFPLPCMPRRHCPLQPRSGHSQGHLLRGSFLQARSRLHLWIAILICFRRVAIAELVAMLVRAGAALESGVV